MLFTDIEGSTELVHRLGDGYSELLDGSPHDPRRCRTERAGHVVETPRRRVLRRVRAAGRRPSTRPWPMQRTLGQSSWPGGVEVRVRVGHAQRLPQAVRRRTTSAWPSTRPRGSAGRPTAGRSSCPADTKLALTRVDAVRHSIPQPGEPSTAWACRTWCPSSRSPPRAWVVASRRRGRRAEPAASPSEPSCRLTPSGCDALASSRCARSARVDRRLAGERVPRACRSRRAAVRRRCGRAAPGGWRTELSGTAAAPANSMSS